MKNNKISGNRCGRDLPNDICSEEMERCVLCWRLTDVPKTRPVSQRIGYIEGVGQLCESCYCTLYTGAHKKVILKITTGASVMQGWQRNNGYPVSAGYPLFFCRYEKQWIYSQLSAIMFLNQSYPIHSEIFSKNLKKFWKHWNNTAVLMLYIVEGYFKTIGGDAYGEAEKPERFHCGAAR